MSAFRVTRVPCYSHPLQSINSPPVYLQLNPSQVCFQLKIHSSSFLILSEQAELVQRSNSGPISMARVRRKWTAEEDTLLRAAVKTGKFQVQVLTSTSRHLRGLL